MTELVFLKDSYKTTLNAIVTRVEDSWLEFDRTIFYPLGGGQPGDTGTLTTTDGACHQITDTRKGDGDASIRHQLTTDSHSISEGMNVELAIDWERRYRLMRMHTCLHVMASLIPVMVTGGSVGEQKSRLDFNLGDHKIDKESLTDKLNALIQSADNVQIESINESELDENPELVRTMSVQPPRGTGKIRMIRIGKIDYQPCGGTHLHNIREIGTARVSKIENKGRQNRRVHVVLED